MKKSLMTENCFSVCYKQAGLGPHHTRQVVAKLCSANIHQANLAVVVPLWLEALLQTQATCVEAQRKPLNVINFEQGDQELGGGKKEIVRSE
jgi:hypothetical protein